MTQPKTVGPYQVVELKLPGGAAKTAVLSVRISADLNRRMHEATDISGYRVSVTTLVSRGIELAIKELAVMRKASS